MLIEIKDCMYATTLLSGEFENIKTAVEKATLTGAYLKDADLTGADLTGAYLKDADLRDADLTGAYLTGACLKDADLTSADLRDADLTGADLTGAYLRGADLRGADLRGACLRGADLRGADLRGADLDTKQCYVSICPIGSENGCLWTIKNEQWLLIYNRGCFSGTEEEFISAVKKKHGGTEHEELYMSAVELIKLRVAQLEGS